MNSQLSTLNPQPPTFPARPVNGGSLDKALPKSGDWYYEPKYNGWRALVHVPTRTMFNRKGERLSIEKEFAGALDKLNCLWIDNGSDGRSQLVPEWLDCEALERRHGIGRGTLIVLDFIGKVQLTYVQRNEALQEWIDPMNEIGFDPCGVNEVRCLKRWRFPDAAWIHLQAENQRLGCQFYEGLVAKRADSIYPLQLRSPDVEFPFWVKHRWAY